MSTSQSWQVTVTLDGVSVGTFDTYSGGGSEAEPAKHRAGGMGEQKAYVALPEYGDVTVGRSFEVERDLELHRRLTPRVGRALASISAQPLDDNGSPVGEPLGRIGRLKGQTDVESDSNSADVAVYELMFTIVGVS